MTDRLTKFNAEAGKYEYRERAKTQGEFAAQREAVIQRLGELEDKASDVAREIDDLERYIRLNEDIALKCKEENGEQNREYWKGKLSAFLQIRGYIDVEIKRQHKEGQK